MVKLEFLYIIYIDKRWVLMSTRSDQEMSGDHELLKMEGNRGRVDGFLNDKHETRLNLINNCLQYEGARLHVADPSHSDLHYAVAADLTGLRELELNATAGEALERSNVAFLTTTKPLVILKLFHASAQNFREFEIVI